MFLDAAPHILAQRQAMSTVKKILRHLNLFNLTSCDSKKVVRLASWSEPATGNRRNE